jgi:sulfate permease, SulP family
MDYGLRTESRPDIVVAPEKSLDETSVPEQEKSFMSEQCLSAEAESPFLVKSPLIRRRIWPRYKFRLATLARVTLAETSETPGAWLVDLSMTGLGLLMSQPLAAGTSVIVKIKSVSQGVPYELSARVAHATAQTDGHWLIGCTLETPLSAEQLEDLLADERKQRLVGMFVPESLASLKDYTWKRFGADIVAGLVVGMVALPLAMAFAIGSGVSPQRGLFTAIVAGFLISALGGSRVQIGGPTGAFVVIVFAIVSRHGYDGLALATLIAGVMLIVMGLSRLGAAVKFIPYPVTTGFTSGIALVIFSQQINDLLGLGITKVPPEFFEKWCTYYQNLQELNWHTVGLSLFSLTILLFWPRLTRKVPAPLVAMLTASGAAYVLGLNVETIGSHFGGIPSKLPVPQLPSVTLERVQELLGPATTIAVLAAIESLLSAVVADGMTGGRHKPNLELVAQGIANLASPLFGGIPATGAIARTATNIKSGGRSPVAGIVHALTLLAVMILAAPLAAYVPLCVLASVLVMVAYTMADIGAFAAVLRAPWPDAFVLLVSFLLTVAFDLTVAVEVGLVLAAFLFIKRMADVTNVQTITREFADLPNDVETDPNSISSRGVPPGVEVYEVNGPFFFGVADKVKDVLSTISGIPKVFILRMRNVPVMDATGLHALLDLRRKCEREGSILVISEIHTQPFIALDRSGHRPEFGEENITAHIDDALNRARKILRLLRANTKRGAN